MEFIEQVPTGVWVGLSVASLVLAVVSLLLMPRLLSRLPADFLVAERPPLRQRLRDEPPARVVLLVGRNLLGLLLLGAGVVMLFVPGQGLLTVLAGLALVDFPGRRALLRRLLRVQRLADAVQRVRKKRGAPPLQGLDR